ncbi:hypothetical protein N8482_02600 [Chitinophagales bacterium]|nr:hypothetical protein [Chitinophagales bacterium]
MSNVELNNYRTVGEDLHYSVDLFKKHFGAFTKMVLAVSASLLILMLIIFVIFFREFIPYELLGLQGDSGLAIGPMDFDALLTEGMFKIGLAYFSFIMLFAIIGTLVSNLAIRSVPFYAERERLPDTTEMQEMATRNFGGVLAFVIVSTLFIIMLAIPGMVLWFFIFAFGLENVNIELISAMSNLLTIVLYPLMIAASVIYGLGLVHRTAYDAGIVASLKKGWELFRYRMWPNIGYQVLIYLVMYAFMIASMMIIGMGVGLSIFVLGEYAAMMAIVIAPFFIFFSFVFSVFTYQAMAVRYHSLLEGKDARMLTSEVDNWEIEPSTGSLEDRLF